MGGTKEGMENLADLNRRLLITLVVDYTLPAGRGIGTANLTSQGCKTQDR